MGADGGVAMLPTESWRGDLPPVSVFIAPFSSILRQYSGPLTASVLEDTLDWFEI